MSKSNKVTKPDQLPSADLAVDERFAAMNADEHYQRQAEQLAGGPAQQQEKENAEIVVRTCKHNPQAIAPECGFCFAPPDVIDGTRPGYVGAPRAVPQLEAIPSPAAAYAPAPGAPQLIPIQDVMKMAAEMAKAIVEGLRAPTEEERIAKERKRNERNRLIQEQREAKEREEELKRNCPHMRADANGGSHSTISAVHNYPDGMPRGICQICQFWIAPGEPLYDRVVALHNSAMQAMIS